MKKPQHSIDKVPHHLYILNIKVLLLVLLLLHIIPRMWVIYVSTQVASIFITTLDHSLNFLIFTSF